MAENPFRWPGRDEIHSAFTKEASNNEGSPLDSHKKMIPWCINNCVLIPQFVTQSKPLEVGDRQINDVDDLKEVDVKDSMDSLVSAVCEWLL